MVSPPFLQASVLQNLRLAMRRQIRRHSTRRTTSSSSRRRLGHIWNRLFHSGGRVRGHAPLLDPPGPTQITLGLHSYRTVNVQGPQTRSRCGAAPGEEVDVGGMSGMDMQPFSPESPASPLSFQSVDSPDTEEMSPISRESSRATQSGPPTPLQSDSSSLSGTSSTFQEIPVPPCPPRASRKLVLELAVNLKGVSLRRYSPLGPLSPISPSVFPSSSQTSLPPPQGPEGTFSSEPSSCSSVKGEESDSHFAVEVSSREINSRDKRRREGKNRLCRLSRAFSDEGGDSGRETTPCWTAEGDTVSTLRLTRPAVCNTCSDKVSLNPPIPPHTKLRDMICTRTLQDKEESANAVRSTGNWICCLCLDQRNGHRAAQGLWFQERVWKMSSVSTPHLNANKLFQTVQEKYLSNPNSKNQSQFWPPEPQ